MAYWVIRTANWIPMRTMTRSCRRLGSAETYRIGVSPRTPRIESASAAASPRTKQITQQLDRPAASEALIEDATGRSVLAATLGQPQSAPPRQGAVGERLPSQSAGGGEPAAQSEVSLPGQPENPRRRQPPGSRRAVRAYQSLGESRNRHRRAGDFRRHQKERACWRLQGRRP